MCKKSNPALYNELSHRCFDNAYGLPFASVFEPDIVNYQKITLSIQNLLNNIQFLFAFNWMTLLFDLYKTRYQERYYPAFIFFTTYINESIESRKLEISGSYFSVFTNLIAIFEYLVEGMS